MEELPFGKICSSAKYVNLTTNKTSRLPLPGYVSGCGCKLKNKIENLQLMQSAEEVKKI